MPFASQTQYCYFSTAHEAELCRNLDLREPNMGGQRVTGLLVTSWRTKRRLMNHCKWPLKPRPWLELMDSCILDFRIAVYIQDLVNDCRMCLSPNLILTWQLISLHLCIVTNW
jgi:hypothetical protein